MSLFLILMLISAAALCETPTGLPVRIAYQSNYCGDSRTTIAHVLENGNVRVLGDGIKDVKRGELASLLEDIFRTRSERVLFIKADPNLPFQSVAEVIDASREQVDFVALMPSAIKPGLCLLIRPAGSLF
jgi:biopolymer transport protein TolR